MQALVLPHLSLASVQSPGQACKATHIMAQLSDAAAAGTGVLELDTARSNRRMHGI